MEVPETRYANSGGLNIAYQTFGEGPDLVLIPPIVSNVELMWESELNRRPIEFVGRHLRVTQFDKRGIGGSDGFDRHPTLEERIDDITAVMDTAGLERAHLLGLSEGGLMAQLFACRHPERVDRLVLMNSTPGAGIAIELAKQGVWDLNIPIDGFNRIAETWGQEPQVLVDWTMPSQAANAAFVRWIGRFQRFSASPADMRRQIDSVIALEGVTDLAAVAAPTMVVHASRDRVIPVEVGRVLAERIPNAVFAEVDAEDHFLWVAPNWRPITERWLSFLLPSLNANRDRRFAAILFTDLVGSTSLSSSMGDDDWSSLLASHDRICDGVIGGRGGRLVKRTGDGILATFDTASAAVRTATALRSELAAIGLVLRAGVHAGEIDVHDDGDISGLAVNIAARVEAAGGAGDVLVTSTVREMLLGSGLDVVERGEHTLKGIEGTWRLHAVP